MEEEIDPKSLLKIRITGLLFSAVPALLGLVIMLVSKSNHLFYLLQIFGALIGAVVAGYALSLLPNSPISWLWFAVTMFLVSFGFPEEWDSYRFFASVVFIVGLFGAFITVLPKSVRYVVGTLCILFHFSSILVATTWPPTAPWLVNQLGTRYYSIYMKFMYLGNAYHFYSPDPGPASHIYFLVKYKHLNEIDPGSKKNVETYEWVSMPTRPDQVRDPLALTYQRRLALSEQCAPATPEALAPLTFEKDDVYGRRNMVSTGLFSSGYPTIPFAPDDVEPKIYQYRVPMPNITGYVLPSYVRHVAAFSQTAEKEVVNIKVYRFEHRIMPPARLAFGLNPFHPTTYRCYFLGDFTTDGKLVDPKDPMLYWLIPILNKPNAKVGEPDYEDYVEKHANVNINWRRP
jgi:hypothetical protein